MGSQTDRETPGKTRFRGIDSPPFPSCLLIKDSHEMHHPPPQKTNTTRAACNDDTYGVSFVVKYINKLLDTFLRSEQKRFLIIFQLALN